MKKSIKQLKKDLSLQQLVILKIFIRELVKNRSQKFKNEVAKEVLELEKYIKDI